LKLIALMSIVLLTLGGCATIFNSPTEKINVVSEPIGARVLINGVKIGETPYVLDLDRRYNVYLTLEKDGCHEKAFLLAPSAEGIWFTLDFVCGIFPCIIDALTGQWNTFGVTNLSIKLETK